MPGRPKPPPLNNLDNLKGWLLPLFLLTGLALGHAQPGSRAIPLAGGACCFSFQYAYTVPAGVTAVETHLLNPGVTFSSIQYPLGSGWQYQTLQQQRRLRWSFPGGPFPTGTHHLFDFCLSGWDSADSVALAVVWRAGNAVVHRDTLRLGCTNCWAATAARVDCQPDSSYRYTFNFTNQSGFRVDALQVREAAGQDLVVEETIALTAPLAAGATLSDLVLHLRAGAAAGDEVCFALTPRHLLDGTISVACCTAEYCVPIPACDRCCTDYDDFAAAVAAGFRSTVSCAEENVQLQGLALNACDRVNFQIAGLGGGLVDGNEAIGISGLAANRWYQACMTVTRQNASGENCYVAASLTVCDSFYYACDTCTLPAMVDWATPCVHQLDLVCGCDNMTYFNSCAATYWAGVADFEYGPCGEPPVDAILLTATLQGNNQVALHWTVGGLVTYRFFQVQRRVQTGPWITLAPAVDPTIFDYFDTMPLLPHVAYRIVGVTWPGKVVFSNLGIIGLVGTQAPDPQGGGRLWPNPATALLQLELPLPGQAIVTAWDALGQQLAQLETDGRGYAQIDVQNWPAGCYSLTALLDNGIRWRRRLVVVR